MAIADMVPLYLTIVMAILVILALVAPGDKANDETTKSEDQNQTK